MAQLKIYERKTIEAMLKSGESLGSIAKAVEKSTSTISREIKNHRLPSDYIGAGRIRNRCLFRTNCTKH